MSNPTASQLRFREHLRDLGCCVSPETHAVQIHHIFGRETKAKINGVTTNIGHWAMLPISWMYHDVHSNHKLNVTHNKKAFEKHFDKQVIIFSEQVEILKKKSKVNRHVNVQDLPSDEIVNAIMEYRK